MARFLDDFLQYLTDSKIRIEKSYEKPIKPAIESKEQDTVRTAQQRNL